MSEHLSLSVGGEDFEMTPDNSSLFTFAGQAAMYNHVFLVLEEREDNHFLGTYVFSESPTYLTLMQFMVQHDYPMHLNLRQAAQCDIDAWEQQAFSDLDKLDDGLPEGWE